MLRAVLTLLTALLLSLPAFAQPPAPLGGDMSATTTKATGSSQARKLADRATDALSPLDFGAIGDGLTHPLSTRYATLAAAQAVCPEATSLAQEIDWCATQAALDWVAAHSATAGVDGTPGGNVRVPANTILKFGTTPLTINRSSLTLEGRDQWSSALLVGASPMLNFGLANGMGIGAATIAATGSGFVVGEQLTLTGLGGACEDPPVITVNTVGSSGEVQTSAVSHAGSCSVPPSNPLDYTTNGVGYGASYNGTFTGTTLTGALLLQSTGTGCVNGEVLTAVGGSTPGGTPRPFQLTVTNAVGGLVQKAGFTISDPGSYGKPPPNPVSTTGSASCVGAKVNISGLTNSRGVLTMRNLHFIADGQGVSVLAGQFNAADRSTILDQLLLDAQGTTYFSGGFDLTSMSNPAISRINARNNLTYVNSNPSEALFVVRSQNNLIGHFEHRWDHLYVGYFTGGAVHYIADAAETVPYQGLKFEQLICVVALHCLRFDNASGHAYSQVHIDDLYGGQTVQQIEMKTGIDVMIANSNFGSGNTRMTPLPSQADMVALTDVGRVNIRGNTCTGLLKAIPSQTCFHLMGGSGNSLMANNIIINSAGVSPFYAYVFDSGVKGNLQSNDLLIGASIQDNGANNLTMLDPPLAAPCLNTGTLVSGSTFLVPDNWSCVYLGGPGSLASLDIMLPANPAPYQQIQFTAFGTITTLTLHANTGQTLGGGMPTTMTSGTPFGVKSMVPGTLVRWQRM